LDFIGVENFADENIFFDGGALCQKKMWLLLFDNATDLILCFCLQQEVC